MSARLSPARRPAARRSAGFTLLETIVTLVIVSMIVVVLMQALQQALGLRTRLLRHERATRTASLQEQWFRDSIGAAIADLPDALGQADGSSTSLTLVTAAPLSAPGLARVTWSLRSVEGGYALDYAEAGGTPLTVLPGPLQHATLDYLDADDHWSREWKVKPVAEGQAAANEMVAVELPDQLPRMVRLQADTTGGRLLWLVPIVAAPRPPGILRPEEYGLGL
jgi:prepilin-type N-terminal cleavage/methylation domain-containing protein